MIRGALLTSMVALLAAPARTQAPPPPPAPACADDPLYRQQDFTLGEWDVFKDGRKTAGVNISRTLGDCALQEVWKPAALGIGHGLGLFTYSRLLKSWTYFWVADGPANPIFKGAATRPGAMLYVTEKPLPSGRTRLRHWTLTRQPDGTIRELSVGTEDDGTTWTTEYELIWHRAG